MNVGRTIVAASVLCFAGVGALEAQQIHAGAHLNYGLEDFSEIGVGIHGTYLVTDYFQGAADFTFYFPDDEVDFWEININGRYLVQIEGNVTPYIGGGINYSRISFDLPDVGFLDTVSTSELGFNLLGGAMVNMGNALRLFGEGRYVLSDLDQFVLSVGVSLPLGTVD